MENGIAKGVGDNSFAPEEKITRQDMAVLLYNYMQGAGWGDTAENAAAAFADAVDIADYAAQAVSTMQRHGIINGKTSTTFGPRDTATRAEAATILARLSRG